MAKAVRASGEDRKWDELSRLLQDNQNMFDAAGQHEKLIIFTEHRDTLNYLTTKIRSLLGRDEAVVNIHGGMLRDERRKIEELFKQDKDTCILVATDAAGEGINLQRAHLMVNYDLPWNPNRLEQRFGRIHRIGQTEVCHLWNLVSKETREGMVFQRLFEKLEEERRALGGKVFDVLGKLTFDNKPLRDLLIEAVRYGNSDEVRAKLYQVVDNSLNRQHLSKILEEQALTEDTMDIHKVMAIREDMERIEAHKLQPYFIESFFIKAFQSVGGKIRKRETGRYEITSVPFAVCNRDMQIGFGEPVLKSYERICFDKSMRNVQGLVPAALICPGHPLLEATIDLVRERNSDVLKRGAVFVDEQDLGTNIRLLFYIEDSIQDGRILPNGNRRIISKNIHFVELEENDIAHSAGYAPYLDYRALTTEEAGKMLPVITGKQWLKGNIEDFASGYAIANIIPEHFKSVKEHKLKMVEKVTKAVKERLTSEIQYWDFRAAELKAKEAAGKKNAKQNSAVAARRAEELQARLQKRLLELDAEKRISALPPVIVGGALIIPVGLLNQMKGQPVGEDVQQSRNCKEIELKAMAAVIKIEKELGCAPKDVSALKCGYDIESIIPEQLRKDGSFMKFIEVKGRVKGAATITVSKNEILTALNKPDEFILAVVEVDGDLTKTVYLKAPFKSAPDFGATSVNYDIANLVKSSEIEFERS